MLAGLAVAVTLPSLLGACSDDAEPETTTTPSSTVSTIVDPDELPQVDATSANADLNYLTGEGAPLDAMVAAVEKVTAGDGPPDGAACAALFEDLTAAGSPEELAELSGAVVDEVLRGALDSVRAAAVAVVSACEAPPGETSEAPDALDQGAQAATLFRQRSAQLEAEG